LLFSSPSHVSFLLKRATNNMVRDFWAAGREGNDAIGEGMWCGERGEKLL